MNIDPPAEYLRELMEQHGVDMATVSQAVGRNHAYIEQYLKGRSPRQIPEDVREKLGGFFGVDPDRFRTKPKPPGRIKAAVFSADMVPYTDKDWERLCMGIAASDCDDAGIVDEPARRRAINGFYAVRRGRVDDWLAEGKSQAWILSTLPESN